jgi:hypothetical protein
MLGAVFLGFFMLAPLMPDEWTLSDAELAEMMAETVRRTLEPPRAVAPDELHAAGQALLHYVNRDVTLAQEQLSDESAS